MLKSKSVINVLSRQNVIIAISLASIFVIAVVIRNYTLSDNLLFGFEQGRDALKAKAIYELKDIVLIGPKTDIDGLFHGVWYYYLIALIYFIVGGNPISAVFVLTTLGSLTCIVIYLIAYELKIRRIYALGASLIYAISFNPTVYSRWLSNVSPSVFVASIFFLFLIKLWRTRREKYWIPVFVAFGFLFHFELLHGLYALSTVILFVIVYRIPIHNRFFRAGCIALLLINLPYLFFEIRHDFILSKGIVAYITHHNLSQKPYLILFEYIVGILDELTTTFGSKIGMIPFFFLGILGYIYKSHRRNRSSNTLRMLILLIFWSLPYVFLLRDKPLSQFYAGTSIILLILTTYVVEHVTPYISRTVLISGYVILGIGMFTYTISSVRARTNIFYHNIQNKMTWKTQSEMVNYMYAQGKPFRWEAFTIPYYLSDAYQYLIPWYGNKHFPNNYQWLNSARSRTLYLIIEPSTEGKWRDKWIAEKNQFSQLVDTHIFGDLILQTRIITSE